MSAQKARTRTEWLRHTDALYTGTGRPLSTTFYDYDRDGKIASTILQLLSGRFIAYDEQGNIGWYKNNEE